jgi:hypothetical protein
MVNGAMTAFYFLFGTGKMNRLFFNMIPGIGDLHRGDI